FNGSVEKIEWKTVVRFEQRLGTLFGRDRSWLIGDAAHVALPIAVQSMNSGLEEGHEIAEAIAEIMLGKSDLESLSDYGSRNLTRWRRLLGLETEKIEFADDASTWVREHARRIATSIPASGDNRRQILAQAGVILDSSTRFAPA
ncbi:MAG: FAD-dependent monooxygenase, partial [Rhodothermia bacterium]|nr:FAD-dependent monooxygenase [Rhodothermia bacterium]